MGKKKSICFLLIGVVFFVPGMIGTIWKPEGLEVSFALFWEVFEEIPRVLGSSWEFP